MRYILILLLFMTTYIANSQNIKQYKKSDTIHIIIKNDSGNDTLTISNSKYIKQILNSLEDIKYNALDNPQYWINKKNWIIKMNFDSPNELIFYDGGYIKIGDDAFFTSTDSVKKFLNRLEKEWSK